MRSMWVSPSATRPAMTRLAEARRSVAMTVAPCNLSTPFITAVAGVVLLLPGFTLTIALSELATQNLLAGTGRLVGAFILLFMMGAGLAIGTQVGQQLIP